MIRLLEKNCKNWFGDQREDSLTSLEVCSLLMEKAGFPMVSKAVFKLSDRFPVKRFPDSKKVQTSNNYSNGLLERVNDKLDCAIN
jgi:hypothetical protein